MHYLRWKRHGDPLKLADPKETHQKLSNARKGKIASIETRGKMSASMKKRKPNSNSLEALRLASKNRIGTKRPEVWRKGSVLLKKKWLDPEFKKKMTLIRQKQFSNPDTLSKMSKSMKRIWTNPEYRKRQSESHKGIIAGMLGKKHSEETRKKISQGISQESRRRLSELHKGEKNPMYGKPSWNKGQSPSEETKRKQREKAQKWLSEHPEFREQASERRSKQKFPFKDSKIELQTQKILSDAVIDFEKHTPIKIGRSYHQADILIRPNRIIEVNGDYWHLNPRFYQAEQQVKIRKKSVKVKEIWDKEETMLNKLRVLGYEIIVVWEYDLKKNLKQTTKKILEFAKF